MNLAAVLVGVLMMGEAGATDGEQPPWTYVKEWAVRLFAAFVRQLGHGADGEVTKGKNGRRHRHETNII